MKKLAISLVITGAGYLITLLYTYAAINTANAETISRINKYESIISILVTLISFGFVQNAARKIATQENWRTTYYNTQGFRLSLSLAISAASLALCFATGEHIYLLGLSSIAISLTGDFALYSRGMPIKGSICSFYRTTIFSLSILFILYMEKKWVTPSTLLIICTGSFAVCGLISALHLKTKYFIKPKIPSTDELKTITLIAFTILAYNVTKPAFILLISEFVDAADQLHYFEFYKIFFIVFSVRRIIVQSLYREIVTSPQSMKSDIVISATLTTIIVFAWITYFAVNNTSLPYQILSLDVLIDVTITTAMISLLPTSFTKLFLLEKDHLLLIPVALSIGFILFAIHTLSQRQQEISYYIYTLGISELIISISSFAILKMHKYPRNKKNIQPEINQKP